MKNKEKAKPLEIIGKLPKNLGREVRQKTLGNNLSEVIRVGIKKKFTNQNLKRFFKNKNISIDFFIENYFIPEFTKQINTRNTKTLEKNSEHFRCWASKKLNKQYYSLDNKEENLVEGTIEAAQAINKWEEIDQAIEKDDLHKIARKIAEGIVLFYFQ